MHKISRPKGHNLERTRLICCVSQRRVPGFRELWNAHATRGAKATYPSLWLSIYISRGYSVGVHETTTPSMMSRWWVLLCCTTCPRMLGPSTSRILSTADFDSVLFLPGISL